MMDKPTKNEMKLAERRLATMTEKRPDPNMMATFRGVHVDKFDFPSLVKICNLFADKWHEADANYLQAASKLFDGIG